MNLRMFKIAPVRLAGLSHIILKIKQDMYLREAASASVP